MATFLYNKSFFLAICTGIIVSSMFTSCIRDDYTLCSDAYISVRVTDADGKEISRKGVLETLNVFLFNQGGFARNLPYDKAKNRIYFRYPKNEPYLLAGWSNIPADSVLQSPVNPGSQAAASNIVLRTDANGYTFPAPDVFLGNLTLNDPNAQAVQEKILTMLSQTCIVTVRVRNIDGSLTRATDPYRIEVRTPHNGLTFDGKPYGEPARYRAIHRISGGILDTEPLRILHSPNVEVDVFNDQTRMLTVNADADGKPLVAPPGKRLHVFVDFTRVGVTILIRVVPWDQVLQDTETGV